jgi:hypothetical protein
MTCGVHHQYKRFSLLSIPSCWLFMPSYSASNAWDAKLLDLLRLAHRVQGSPLSQGGVS